MTKLPTIIDGVPYCSENTCPAFDGKRCEILGRKPGNVCQPAVSEMSAAVADLRDRLKLLAPYVCKRCGCAPVEIETYCGEVESTEFCEDCLLKHPDDAAASISRFCRAVAGRRLIP